MKANIYNFVKLISNYATHLNNNSSSKNQQVKVAQLLGKVKLALEQATKTQRGSSSILLLFLLPRSYLVVGG